MKGSIKGHHINSIVLGPYWTSLTATVRRERVGNGLQETTKKASVSVEQRKKRYVTDIRQKTKKESRQT